MESPARNARIPSAAPVPTVPASAVEAAPRPRAPNGPTMVTIYNVETGEARRTKGINGREAVDSGYWTFTPPGDTGKAKAPGAKARVAQLKEMDEDELFALAAQHGASPKNAAAAIEAILEAESATPSADAAKRDVRQRELEDMSPEGLKKLAEKTGAKGRTKADKIESILDAEFAGGE